MNEISLRYEPVRPAARWSAQPYLWPDAIDTAGGGLAIQS